MGDGSEQGHQQHETGGHEVLVVDSDRLCAGRSAPRDRLRRPVPAARGGDRLRHHPLPETGSRLTRYGFSFIELPLPRTATTSPSLCCSTWPDLRETSP